MDWSKVELPSDVKLSRIHNFVYMVAGKNLIVEINEYPNGNFVGYAELTNDESQKIEPANGDSLESCLSNLLKNCT